MCVFLSIETKAGICIGGYLLSDGMWILLIAPQ